MESLHRRASGIYVARLTVPLRHQAVIGKRELIASTGSRELAVARIVAGELVAAWRRRFHNLDRLGAGLDVLQLTLGSPQLRNGGHIPLRLAVEQSGIDDDTLLRMAREGRLSLFVRVSGLDGYVLNSDDCERHVTPEGVQLIVPSPDQMPEHAAQRSFHGLLRVREPSVYVDLLLRGEEAAPVLFDVPDAAPGQCFAPVRAKPLDRGEVELSCDELERLRGALASTVTAEQIKAANEARNATVGRAVAPKASRLMSEAIDAFMTDRSKLCSPDQARRIRAACDLFVDLEGDLQVDEVTRDRLRNYRDHVLPSVPANENKVRLKHGTTSVKGSLAAVAGTDWPSLSPNECVKRMTWLADLFDWLAKEQWIDIDPAQGLTVASNAAAALKTRKRRDQDSRDIFTRDEIQRIFSEPWFRTGRGHLTKVGTFREFNPYYYWLPLIGLLTGARMNEICQLSLADIEQSTSGVWCINFNEEEIDSETGETRKRLKNRNSARIVPLHPLLVNLGLIRYRDALKAAGHNRLFPELKFDQVKGYGKAATKWFSKMLAGYGWPRDGKKVFHSFRHTLASECINVLGLSESLTAQISGHQRGSTVLMKTYKKDVPAELISAIDLLDFNLPHIEPFDIDAGLQAVHDALRRKCAGRGASA